MAQVYQDYDAFAVDTPADNLPIFSDPSNQYDVKNVATGNFAGNVIRRNTDVNDIDHRLVYEESAIDIAQPFEIQHTYAPTNASGGYSTRIYLGYSGDGRPLDSAIQVSWDDGFNGLRFQIDGSTVAQDPGNTANRSQPNRLWITFDGSTYRIYTQKGSSLDLGDSKPATPALSYESAAPTSSGNFVVLQQQSGLADFYNLGIGTDGDPAPTAFLPPGGVSYGEGFYETVASGVAAVDEVEVALMSGTEVVETLTTTTSPTASSGSINWLPSQLTFQSVDGTFNNVRIRVRVDGAGTFADVGTWATGNQSPSGNNVTVSNITTTNNSEPAFGVLAGADTFTEPVRFQLLDSSDAVLVESVETVGIGPGPDYLFLGSADIQNTTGDTITITGLSLRLDTGTGEVDFATGMTLVDNDTFSTPLSAELQNNQVLSLTETRITYTEED